MYKVLLTIGIAMAAIAPAVFAQESAIPLEDVVVSAYKSGITYGQSSSVSIITSKDIEQGGYRFVSDVLQTVPGLSIVQNSTLGGTASVFIRGAKTGNAVVLIDGVKVLDPSTIERTFDFGTLTTDSIERIEIIKGPQSALYGSDATGGIINIVTKRGQSKPQVAISLYGGSYYTTQLSANVSAGDSSFNYSLTAGQLSAKGYSRATKPSTATTPFDDDGFYQRYILGKCGYTPIQSLHIDAGFTAKESDIELDDYSLTDDANSFENRKELSGYTQLEHVIAPYWKHSLTVNASSTVRTYDDFDDDGNTGFSDFGADNRYTGTIANAEWMHTFTLKDINTLSIGIHYEKEFSKVQDYLVSSKITQDNSTTGLFVQNHLNASNILYITAGVRADNNAIFGWQQSYNIAPALVIPVVKTRCKGNWGKGYKAPSLYQIYGDGGSSVLGNKDLQPEENTGYDIGIEQPISNFIKCEVVYFANNYRNMIEYDSSSWPGKYINIDKITTKGWEGNVTIQPFEALTISGGYTYLNAIDESTDEQLLRRPKHQGYGSVNVTINNFSISCIGTYIGKRKDAYFDSSTFTTITKNLDSYIKLDTALNYALTPQITISAKVENITNKKYQQVYGYNMPERSFYVGLKATL
ncbi:MAG: TonB-dependent receptor [Spirochaetota bacterium]